jgi:hypothetical protein
MIRRNKHKQRKYINLWKTPKLFLMLQLVLKNKLQDPKLFKLVVQKKK